LVSTFLVAAGGKVIAIKYVIYFLGQR